MRAFQAKDAPTDSAGQDAGQDELMNCVTKFFAKHMVQGGMALATAATRLGRTFDCVAR